MQRIVGGRLKGHRLTPLPRGVQGVRPTSSRARGAIFDRLQREVRGATVLDLFAGSGALAFEALSRGASSAWLVEQGRKVARHLRSEARRLGLDEVTVVEADALRWLEGPAPTRFDLVFIDPPYANVDAYACALAGLLAPGWLAEDATLVVERERRAAGLEPWPAEYQSEAERRHGDTVLHFLRFSGPGGGPRQGA